MVLIPCVGLGQWLAGSWLVTQAYTSTIFVVSAVGACALLTGFFVRYWVSRHRWHSYPAGGRLLIRIAGERRSALGMVSVVVLTLIFVHFARGGVPLFAQNVETARFDLSSSGFMGIPSRAYLYMLPVLAIASARLDDKNQREQWLTSILWLAVIVTRLLGGLKSGMLEVAFLGMLVWLTSSHRPHIFSRIGLRIAGVAVVALMGAVLVSTQYGTIEIENRSDAVEYFAYRLTTGTVRGGAVVVEGLSDAGNSNLILLDFAYYLSRYTGSPGDIDSVSRLASSAVHNVSLDGSAYVSPVVVGGAPTLHRDFGYYGVVVGMFALGMLLHYFTHLARVSRGLAAGFSCLAALAISHIVTNGGYAYFSLNVAGSALLLLVITLVVTELTRGPSSRPAPAKSSSRQSISTVQGRSVHR